MDPITREFVDQSAKMFVTALCAPMHMMLAACAATVNLMAFTNHAVLARDRPG